MTIADRHPKDNSTTFRNTRQQ